jgi:hypothetical protein
MTTPTKPPLHGTKTHPLTAHALSVLRSIASKPMPVQEINPGVADRFQRESLVDDVMLPSPYSTHKGKPIKHYTLSAAGRSVLGLPPK